MPKTIRHPANVSVAHHPHGEGIAADTGSPQERPDALGAGFRVVRYLIPRHFGFCYGVQNAIDIAYRAVEQNEGSAFSCSVK